MVTVGVVAIIAGNIIIFVGAVARDVPGTAVGAVIATIGAAIATRYSGRGHR